MKVLIAYDGSGCANEAIRDLARAGLGDDVHALVFSVAEVWLPPRLERVEESASGRKVPASVARARARAENVVKQAATQAALAADLVRVRHPLWRVESDAVADSPAWGVLKMANDWQPDLIVMGSQGHSMLGRFLLGSVSQKVLSEANVPVRIARSSPNPEGAPPRVLIAYDGSVDAEVAVRSTAARYWPPQTEVLILAVIDPIVSHAEPPLSEWPVEYGEEAYEQEAHWVEESLESHARMFADAGVSTEHRTVEGDPRRAIPQVAEEWRADAIVLGARGLGRLERLLLGSVSASVASRAHCTVEVVRHPSTVEADPDPLSTNS